MCILCGHKSCKVIIVNMFILLEYVTLNPFDVCFCQFMLIKVATYIKVRIMKIILTYKSEHFECMTVLKDYLCSKRKTACSSVLTILLKNSCRNDRCITLE